MNAVTLRMASLLALSVLLAVLRCPAQQPAPAAPSSPLAAAVAQLKSGHFAEALKIADEALATGPDNLDLKVAKVDALMGLRRYQEAGNLGWQLANQHPERPELRLKAGLSAYRCGAYSPSAKAWDMLSTVQGWSARGYHLGIECALSLGDPATARKLLKRGLGEVSPPSHDLIQDLVMTETDPKAALPALDAYLKGASIDVEFCAAQRALYAAAGEAPLFQCEPPPKGPIVIPLSEKSDSKALARLDSDQSGASAWDERRTSTSVVLPISINGGTTQWPALDSGCSFMMVSQEAAQEAKLQPLSTGQYAGIGEKDTAKTDWVLLQKVQVGPMIFHNVPAMLVAKKSDFWAKRGIVPISLFKDWAVHYDRRHSRLEILPSGTDPEQVMGKGTFKVRSLWFWGKPYVYTRIQEMGGLPCQIDTGAFATFIAAEHAPEVGVKPNTGKYANPSVLGMTGVISSGVAEKVQVGIGVDNFNLTAVQVLPLNLDNELTPVYGNVGREILDLFEIFFDYNTNTVAFKAYK